MGQLDGDSATAASFNLGGLTFLDVHGNVTHRSHPDILVVLLGPLEAVFNGAERRGRVGGGSVILVFKTVGEECDPAALLYGLLHVALEVVRAGGTSHDSGCHCPIARTVLAHHVGLALPGTVTDTANDVVLLHGALVWDVAVRISDRDDAVLLLDFACDRLLRGGFFAAHVLAVGVTVASDFVAVLGHIAETTPVRIPVHHHVECSLVAVLVEQRSAIAHVARSAVVKRERRSTLAEACPCSDFCILGVNH